MVRCTVEGLQRLQHSATVQWNTDLASNAHFAKRLKLFLTIAKSRMNGRREHSFIGAIFALACLCTLADSLSPKLGYRQTNSVLEKAQKLREQYMKSNVRPHTESNKEMGNREDLEIRKSESSSQTASSTSLFSTLSSLSSLSSSVRSVFSKFSTLGRRPHHEGIKVNRTKRGVYGACLKMPQVPPSDAYYAWFSPGSIHMGESDISWDWVQFSSTIFPFSIEKSHSPILSITFTCTYIAFHISKFS